jgi:hypothetical protein
VTFTDQRTLPARGLTMFACLLLDIALLHVSSELPQVQFVECVLQRQSCPAEAVSRLEGLGND